MDATMCYEPARVEDGCVEIDACYYAGHDELSGLLGTAALPWLLPADRHEAA